MAITNTAIATDSTILYTSVGSNAITTVIICNSGDPTTPEAVLTNLYLYAIPAADITLDISNFVVPPAASIIVNGLPIPGGETVTFDQEKMVLSDGDILVAKSDALLPANLVATVSTLAV